MCKLTPFGSFLSIISIVCLALATGCGSQAVHPNQFNQFDGASFDSLTLAHGALTSLRAQIALSHAKYAPIYNEAAASYAAAYDAYVVYRTNPKDQTSMNLAIANLTISIVALENTFQTDMKASPAVVADVRRNARTLREKAVHQNVSVSDILTELEIAAAIARTIPATQAYAGIASMVIAATSEALSEEAAQAGQPIDLSKIEPVTTL